jgi:uncharacterized membrane-anchored protein
VDRSLGIGYLGGSSILVVSLLATLGLWYWSQGSISVHAISNRTAEIFYWATIMVSQTLGTALGDWIADDETGLKFGFEMGALFFGGGLLVVTALYYWTAVSRTLLFWIAFVLTRPLGATLGDLLDKSHEHGGLEITRSTATLVLLAIMVACIVVFPKRAAPQTT